MLEAFLMSSNPGPECWLSSIRRLEVRRTLVTHGLNRTGQSWIILSSKFQSVELNLFYLDQTCLGGNVTVSVLRHEEEKGGLRLEGWVFIPGRFYLSFLPFSVLLTSTLSWAWQHESRASIDNVYPVFSSRECQSSYFLGEAAEYDNSQHYQEITLWCVQELTHRIQTAHCCGDCRRQLRLLYSLVSMAGQLPSSAAF